VPLQTNQRKVALGRCRQSLSVRQTTALERSQLRPSSSIGAVPPGALSDVMSRRLESTPQWDASRFGTRLPDGTSRRILVCFTFVQRPIVFCADLDPQVTQSLAFEARHCVAALRWPDSQIPHGSSGLVENDCQLSLTSVPVHIYRRDENTQCVDCDGYGDEVMLIRSPDKERDQDRVN
jgi:hypothetical protein